MTRVGSYRLGVDVGGTFTDLVLTAPDGQVMTRKVLSATDDYATAIISGTRDLLQVAGVTAADLAEVLHGTTVATNAILERRGAATGLLTTEGFRDILEIGRLRLARLYDLDFERPAPLVPRRWRQAVTERIDHLGNVRIPLDRASVERALDRLLGEGVRSIAISLLHAYADGRHEQAVAAIVRERAPGVPLTLSSELLPEVGEFERTSTTVTNAYVLPAMDQYLGRLESELAALDVRAEVLVMQSNGGVMTASEGRRRPVHVIESGPAAGVIAAAALARRIGRPNAISVDMGGTTAKASVIEDYRIQRAGEFEIGGNLSQGSRLNKGSGFLLRVPAIDIAEIGAGGGSIVRVDDARQLHVGPRSAGAIPGPACYAQGGTHATLTDANVVLGYLDNDRLPSGLRLDAELARQAVGDQVAAPLGLDLLPAAHGVFLLGGARMARAVRAVTVERGRDPRDFAIVAFGGNGPLFAAEMAAGLGVRTVVVPPAPGVFSAVGLLEADLEHHLVRTFLRPLTGAVLPEIDRRFAALEAEAGDVLGGGSVGGLEMQRAVDLKYVGQSYELTIPLPDGSDADVRFAGLVEQFAREHDRTYGHASLADPVALVNLRLTARVPRRERAASWRVTAARGTAGRTRDTWFGSAHGLLATPVIGRGDLDAPPTAGPLLVDEYDATTVVPPGATACLDEHGNIVIVTTAAAR
jgi:N-methylhydantoinase A